LPWIVSNGHCYVQYSSVFCFPPSHHVNGHNEYRLIHFSCFPFAIFQCSVEPPGSQTVSNNPVVSCKLKMGDMFAPISQFRSEQSAVALNSVLTQSSLKGTVWRRIVWSPELAIRASVGSDQRSVGLWLMQNSRAHSTEFDYPRTCLVT
jgi:hypothetical protein